MTESTNLGAGDCPIKGCSGTASFSLSKKGLPVATCMTCKCQVFSRGEVSDELMRDLIQAKPAPAAAPAAPAPLLAQHREQQPVCHGCGIPAGDVHMSTCKSGKWPSRVSNGDTAAQAPVATPTPPPPPPKTQRISWGMLGA